MVELLSSPINLYTLIDLYVKRSISTLLKELGKKNLLTTIVKNLISNLQLQTE